MKNNIIKGKSILAMTSDKMSITEMLTLLGVEPKAEIVDEAMTRFASTGFTMTDMGKFLMDKGIFSRMVCSDLR